MIASKLLAAKDIVKEKLSGATKYIGDKVKEKIGNKTDDKSDDKVKSVITPKTPMEPITGEIIEKLKKELESHLFESLKTQLNEKNIQKLLDETINKKEVQADITKVYTKNVVTEFEKNIRVFFFRMDDLETKKALWKYFIKQKSIKDLLIDFVIKTDLTDSQKSNFHKLILFLKQSLIPDDDDDDDEKKGGNITVEDVENSDAAKLKIQAHIWTVLYSTIQDIINKQINEMIKDNLKNVLDKHFENINKYLTTQITETAIFKDPQMLFYFFRAFLFFINEANTNDNIEIQKVIGNYVVRFNQEYLKAVVANADKTGGRPFTVKKKSKKRSNRKSNKRSKKKANRKSKKKSNRKGGK